MRSADKRPARPMRALTPLSLLARFAVMAALGLMILSLLQRREAHPHALLSGVVSLGAGLMVAFFPGLLMKSVTLAVGLWSLLVCAAQLAMWRSWP